ncbi:MerR family transcriptional regulator [Paenibacillus glycanilyticus]|uniref:HTH merR-type domain-containing protein n=1 Tax=Paenibacillus glycanilyticus TaxID=126569 RepID=A0ABQ6GE07_9BACL|nr:MerR family transcriptional regulator [Paenibacillus glycanilyticus]GLX67297.1 hypothetical protein MU1_16420 [Paenibacillus glycanilyticus]
MTLLKTKEAAQQLVVSETTVRRWVSTFQASFRKDMFGHYIFDAPAMDKLRRIKSQLDSGTALYDIKIPTLADEDALAALAAEVMNNGAAAASENSGKLVVDEAGNVHAAEQGAISAGTSGLGRGGGAGALVVDSSGKVHAAGGSPVAREASKGNHAGALIVDSAGNVYTAGGGMLSGEAGASEASAEITAGMQHAAATAQVAGNDRLAPSPANPVSQPQQTSQTSVPSAAPTHHSSSLFDETDHETDPMLERLDAIEAALSQKADEVVTVQLLHHRKELEELRKSLTELAATIEALRTPQQELAAFSESASPDKRKKRGLRSFFFF